MAEHAQDDQESPEAALRAFMGEKDEHWNEAERIYHLWGYLGVLHQLVALVLRGHDQRSVLRLVESLEAIEHTDLLYPRHVGLGVQSALAMTRRMLHLARS